MGVQTNTAFWETVDRHAVDAQQLVPRFGFAQVTDAATPFSYSVQYNTDQDPIANVGRLSAQVPLVGDMVAVINVDGLLFITAVRGRGPIRASTDTVGSASTSSATYISSGAGTDVLTQDLVAGQQVWITVSSKSSHSAGAGHGAVLSFKAQGPVTLYGPNDADGTEVDGSDNVTAARTTLFTASETGTHTVTLQYKAINGANATWAQRRLTIEE